MAEGDIEDDPRPWVRVRPNSSEWAEKAGVLCDGCQRVRHQRDWTIVHVNPPVPLRIAFWFCCETCTQAFVVAHTVEHA